QAAKAGILEIGDIFVVNKADRDGAASTRRELRSVVAMSDRSDDAWKPPVLLAIATTGEGVDDVAEQIALHHQHLADSGELGRRRLARTRREIEALALNAVRERFGDLSGDARLDSLAAEVLAGATDPYAAADTLLENL
ncbi:MAG: methylmalonyl Co-A mutase-associated GTPase MeaB, partial [Aeromicrobium sp.]